MANSTSQRPWFAPNPPRTLSIIDPISRAQINLPSTTRPPNSHASSTEPPPPSAHSFQDAGVHNSADITSAAFNVYARPFVPEAFTVINQLGGYCYATAATKQFDFNTYSRGFVGTDVLIPLPQPTSDSIDPSTSREIIPTNYERIFKRMLKDEIESQQRENESYSLYGHSVTVFPANTLEPTNCTFEVPGLRENSPYIEEDDVIELRELVYDSMGRLFGMEYWLAKPTSYAVSQIRPFAPGGRWRNENAPGWTNIVYKSRVSAVQRKNGTLLVKVTGLPPSNSTIRQSQLNTNRLKFNIQFPVPMNRYVPLHQALSLVQHGLTHAQRVQVQSRHIQEAINAARSQLPMHHDPPTPKQLDNSSETWIRSMLFPSEIDCELQTNLNAGLFKRPFFDEHLNYEQKKATESICSQNYGTLPFLISGPPGTGKTKTLVEIALQLVSSVEKVSHILICAPSDPAADIILRRLTLHLKSSELLRLNRPTRTFAEVPGEVLPFCYVTNDKFNLPPFRKLMAYKVVVTTCRDAALLVQARLSNSDLYTAEYSLRSVIHPYSPSASQVEMHWTALLMDESAQAIEPEAIIPLTVVAPPLECVRLAFTPIVVMAGDEYQLGPRTSLPTTPLRTSLFARLFARDVYANHLLARNKGAVAPPVLKSENLPINRPAFANLIRNYRSHPAILAVPSALFYSDTLEPEASDIDRLADWKGWRGRGWPVLYHNNNSKDELETDGGGWYNIGEAEIACQYAAELVGSGLVAQNEICIMSPFKAQVKWLRKRVQQEKLWEVDVGPMEAFQGLERGVVILCTTRSKQEFVERDKEVDWGVIGLPNKTNVALTRAKFGLIVIGRAAILQRDPNWKAFMDFCGRNGLVSGLTENEDWLLTTDGTRITRLEKVLLANESTVSGSRALRVTSQEDEMWTAGMQATLDMESSLDVYQYDTDANSEDGSCSMDDEESSSD